MTDLLLSPEDLAGFGDFRLQTVLVSPSRRLVSGPTRDIAIEPRVMQVIVALAEDPGQVLTRDQLVRRCWGRVFVAEDSLNRAISEARRALRDAGLDAPAIETISKTGYRLAIEPMPIEATPIEPRASNPEPELPSPVLGDAVPRRGLVFGAAALAIAAVGGTALWRARPSPAAKEAQALLAQAVLESRTGLPGGDRQGIALLEQATRLQPDDARLWGQLALARARSDEHATPGEPVSPAALVQNAAGKALAIDPDEINALAALAIVQPYYGDWLAAEKRLDAVLERDPDHLATLDSRAFFLNAVGRSQEGALSRVDFSPRDPLDAALQYRLVYCLWMLGRIGEADRAATRGLELWPKHPGLWFSRLWVLAGTKRLDRALAQVEDAANRPPIPPPMLAALAATLRAAVSGSRSDVEAGHAANMKLVARSPSAVVQSMMLLNIMGALDNAFALADAYYLERGPVRAAVTWGEGMPVAPDQRRRKTNMLFVPIAERMQADPRFMPLMKEIGLTDYWRARAVRPDFLRS